MTESADRPEPKYIPDLQPREQHPDPDVAQDPNMLALSSFDQVAPGQEFEPAKTVVFRTTGKPRRKTTGVIKRGGSVLKAQASSRVDITIIENAGTGQTEFMKTVDMNLQFGQTGVLPSDHPEISIKDAEAIDLSDVSGPLLSTVRKKRGGASLKHRPIEKPGSRIIPVKERQTFLSHVEKIRSMHHAQLISSLRYARYMQGETPAEWEELLGPDVVGLTHPDVVADITDRFVSFNTIRGVALSKDEQTLLFAAPWIHDWGELVVDGVGIGDVTFDQKTTTHEGIEAWVFDMVLKDIEDDDVKRLMQDAYGKVVQNRDSNPGRMFNAIERIGYLEIAIRAYAGTEGKRIANWRGLAGNTLSNQIEKLLEYRTDYPYVDDVLTRASNTIQQMFHDVMSEEVPLDNDGVPAYDADKLRKSHAAWSDREK